jgi:hypothetical protein
MTGDTRFVSCLEFRQSLLWVLFQSYGVLTANASSKSQANNAEGSFSARLIFFPFFLAEQKG